MAVFEETVVQFFPMFNAQLPSNIKCPTVSQFLAFLESASTNFHFGNVNQLMSYSQIVKLDRAITNLTITQLFLMSQEGSESYPEVINQFFGMWDSATIVAAYEPISQFLSFVQIVSGLASKACSDTFTMTQLASYTSYRSHTLTQSFIMVSHGEAYLLNPNFLGLDTIALTGPNSEPEYVF